MNNKGNIFKELRREAGYTQKSLADALHITDKAVSKWERGICLPDVSLLPQLSLLLGTEVEQILAHTNDNGKNSDWAGVIDLSGFDCNLGQMVYDKPMVYYFLSHYLLLGIKDIWVKTSEGNIEYLKSSELEKYGFKFHLDFSNLPSTGLMIMNGPCFLFGSDLTRLFTGAMLSGNITAAQPKNSPVPFVFCPAGYAAWYKKSPDIIKETANYKNFGRGMFCFMLDSDEAVLNASNLVRIYQKNTGLKIADLDEIAGIKN